MELWQIIRDGPSVGLVGRVKAALDRGANPNTKDERGFDALWYFASYDEGHCDHKSRVVVYETIFKMLIDAGADVNSVLYSGKSLVEHCFEHDYIDMFWKLWKGPTQRLLRTNIRGRTLLHLVILHSKKMSRNSSVSSMRFALDHGVDINTQDWKGKTALHYAVIKHDFYMCTFLVKNGINVDLKNTDGKTALEQSIFTPKEITVYLSTLRN